MPWAQPGSLQCARPPPGGSTAPPRPPLAAPARPLVDVQPLGAAISAWRPLSSLPRPPLLDMVGYSSFLIQPKAGKSWDGLGTHHIRILGVTLTLLETCKSLAGQLAKEEGLGPGPGSRSPGSASGFGMPSQPPAECPPEAGAGLLQLAGTPVPGLGLGRGEKGPSPAVPSVPDVHGPVGTCA